MPTEDDHVVLDKILEYARALLPGRAFVILLGGVRIIDDVESVSNLSADQEQLLIRKVFVSEQVEYAFVAKKDD